MKWKLSFDTKEIAESVLVVLILYWIEAPWWAWILVVLSWIGYKHNR